MWFVLEIYNYDENFESIDDMMIAENLVESFSFEDPKDEEEFNRIIRVIDREGYLYKIYKASNGRAANQEFFCSGVFSADSLFDDLMADKMQEDEEVIMDETPNINDVNEEN